MAVSPGLYLRPYLLRTYNWHIKCPHLVDDEHGGGRGRMQVTSNPQPATRASAATLLSPPLGYCFFQSCSIISCLVLVISFQGSQYSIIKTSLNRHTYQPRRKPRNYPFLYKESLKWKRKKTLVCHAWKKENKADIKVDQAGGLIWRFNALKRPRLPLALSVGQESQVRVVNKWSARLGALHSLGGEGRAQGPSSGISAVAGCSVPRWGRGATGRCRCCWVPGSECGGPGRTHCRVGEDLQQMAGTVKTQQAMGPHDLCWLYLGQNSILMRCRFEVNHLWQELGRWRRPLWRLFYLVSQNGCCRFLLFVLPLLPSLFPTPVLTCKWW